MKIKVSILCLLILTLLINTVIFAYSFDDVSKSNEKSGAVTDVVDSVVNDEDGTMHVLNGHVRKIAHLIEFALLGITVALCLYLIKRHYSKRFYGLGCFYALSVAVLDEYIQSFSDRTSSVNDVLLDFCGFVIGAIAISIGIRVFLIVRKIRQKKAEQQEEK